VETIIVLIYIYPRLRVAADFSKSLEYLNGQSEPQKEPIDVLRSILGELRKANTSPSKDGHQDIVTFSKPRDVVPGNAIENSFDFVEKVSSRQQELQQRQASAREVAEQLRDLLTLEQQQASIIEATAALHRADETVKQGRTIMVFTVITIIFLPLSFMSSVFGMNAKELSGSDGGVMSLKAQFRLMCMFHSSVLYTCSHTNPDYKFQSPCF
jgi:Mg2+ and Co2+ transporter CorA